MVGRCVFDRTASMNNKIFHSFLFFVCVCVDDTCMCECKHIDGSVDRPGALSLFAVPSFTSPPTTTTTTTTGTATVYISGGVFVVMRLWREALGAAGNWQTRWRGMFGLYS